MYELLRADLALGQKSQELAVQFQRAPSQQRERLKGEIETLVGEHFQLRQQRRELELKRLEAELQRLRDAIQKRNEAREQLIQQRVSELLGLDDGLQF
jgi:hypothetical protein